MYSPTRSTSPVKRRSSEPHHARSRPSIVINSDLIPATSSTLQRPVNSRKKLFYLVLITLVCSYAQYKLFEPSLSTLLSLAETGTRSEIVDKNLPFSQATFTLQEPSYEILILRSAIRHQNDTWRNAIPSKHSAKWFVQTLAWLRVKGGGIRPDHNSISAVCRTAHDEEEESIGIQADVDVVWTDVRDRGIGQDLMLLLECDISPFLPEDLLPSTSTNDQASHNQASNSSELPESESVSVDDIRNQLQPIHLDFTFEHDLGTVETTSSGPMPLNLWFTATNLTIKFDEPREHVKMAGCLSPAFYDNVDVYGRSGLNKHLLRWLEWREHMRHLGVERVNWYGRSEDMKDFVDVYNDIQGMKDTFKWAPPLGANANLRINPYHDQDAYLTDCILSNRDSSDYLFVLDYDEYPMVDFDHDTLSPAQQWLRYMDSLPDEAGSWEMSRIPMSSGKKMNRLDEDVLYQDQLDCSNGMDEKVKSFYKSKTVLAVNQHKKIRMYPIGEKLVKSPKMKRDWKFSGQSWDSSKEDTWPKLFHYRWFMEASENGCTRPSPLNDSPGYLRYLKELRADVFELKAQMEQELL